MQTTNTNLILPIRRTILFIFKIILATIGQAETSVVITKILRKTLTARQCIQLSSMLKRYDVKYLILHCYTVSRTIWAYLMSSLVVKLAGTEFPEFHGKEHSIQTFELIKLILNSYPGFNGQSKWYSEFVIG